MKRNCILHPQRSISVWGNRLLWWRNPYFYLQPPTYAACFDTVWFLHEIFRQIRNVTPIRPHDWPQFLLIMCEADAKSMAQALFFGEHKIKSLVFVLSLLPFSSGRGRGERTLIFRVLSLSRQLLLIIILFLWSTIFPMSLPSSIIFKIALDIPKEYGRFLPG